MAFRAAGEGLDREERQRRLQEYEDLVDQNYDPFHEKCGENVVFSDKRLVATRRPNSEPWYGKKMVFSAKPIRVGRMFQVKLLEKGRGLRGSLVSAQSDLGYMCPAYLSTNYTYKKVGGAF